MEGREDVLSVWSGVGVVWRRKFVGGGGAVVL